MIHSKTTILAAVLGTVLSGAVFAQDPAFRLFWRGTMPLLLNALMYGPSL